MTASSNLSTKQRLAIVILLGTLVALHLALFGFASLVTDSGRDLANAWAVAQGGPYPFYGPELFGRWKLGPVWFWLLALPVKVTGSVTGTALFVGALAATKIVLAYFLGRRMLDARLGLLAAAFIALPGWTSVGTLVIAHPSVVESTMLATFLLALIAWQDRSYRAVLAACLMLSLALHSHPTTLLAAPAVGVAVWRVVVRERRAVRLFTCALIFSLPFLPALYAEAHSGWPQAQASLGYLSELNLSTRLAHLPQLSWALLTGGVWFAGHFLLTPEFPHFWWLAHAVLFGLAVLGGLRLMLTSEPSTPHRWLLTVLGGGAAAITFIALLRDTTPTWMAYSLAPFGVFVLALGWYGLISRRRGADKMVVMVCLACISVNLIQLNQRIALEGVGRILLPGSSIGNITASHAAPATYSPWLSVRQFDALAIEACAKPERIALHGELAMIFDFSQGVAARLHCGQHPLPRLGGREADNHLAGLSAALAAELGFDPQPRRYGHVLRIPSQILAPERGRDAEVDVLYRLERQAELNRTGDTVLTGQVTCMTGEMLVVTNLMPLVNPFVREVRSIHGTLTPRAQTLGATYFNCDNSELHWRVVTPDPSSSDVVVISKEPG